MTLPSNILQSVQTYQKSDLAFLQNYSCFIRNCNTKFKNFQELTAQLGSTVTFDLPPRGVVTNNLVVTFQSAVQRVQSLSVDQQFSYANDFNVQQFVFNVKDYLQMFGKAAIAELGSVIEANIALNAVSGVINNDPNSASQGTANTNSVPYRFYGDGLTFINSYNQIGKMLSNFRNYGCPTNGKLKVFLTDTMIPDIVSSGFSQFVIDRNEEDFQSWMLGSFDNAEFYRSNLLPVHTAGTVGNSAQTLTVISTNDSTGANVTQITFSGATASDTQAVKAGDLFQFSDGVSGQTNLRFLTFIGHQVSAQPVQFRATADAAADGSGHVTVTLVAGSNGQGLTWQSGNQNQNVNVQIAAGMQVTALPNHRAGLIVAGEAMYLAMPRLPDETPYPTANESDPETGVSIRHYYGSLFGQNQRGYVRDCIMGSTIVPEYSMRIAVPV